jgi:hypothetical protein
MHDIRELVLLGEIEAPHVFDPPTAIFSRDAIPRSRLEREATLIDPPPRGQNVRAPIDGVCITRKSFCELRITD